MMEGLCFVLLANMCW